MFVRNSVDWEEVQRYYDAGHTGVDCQRLFSISNGLWDAAVRRGQLVRRESGTPRTGTRAAVEELIGQGLPQAEIARRPGVSKPTVSFHARRIGVPARSSFARRYDWKKVREFYEAGHSASECRREFGFGRNAWADAIRRGAIYPRPRLEPLEAVLAAGRARSRQHVKQRLLAAGKKPLVCEICGLSEWRGRPLSLELHHVNGDGRDNRLENLQLLCPNCPCQTDTWGARNKGRAPRPAASSEERAVPP